MANHRRARRRPRPRLNQPTPTPLRIMAKPPMRKPERTEPLFRAWQSENTTSKSRGRQIARSASSLERDGGRRDASASQTAPAPPKCSTTLGPKNDAVTTSAVAPQRWCDGATVWAAMLA
jgi:hypothetical protein